MGLKTMVFFDVIWFTDGLGDFEVCDNCVCLGNLRFGGRGIVEPWLFSPICCYKPGNMGLV
jgi:hypothetical protein